jgi:hypothetical protein
MALQLVYRARLSPIVTLPSHLYPSQNFRVAQALAQ